MRIAVLAVVGFVAVAAGGAALAATRSSSAATIGTGIVVINTNLAYENGSAAGTGMVLTSSGEILTNNHVIAGATTITVKVPGTTHSYKATVVGYDVTDDVAVLKLANASSLKTVSTGTAVVGATVTAIGNAGGTGSLLSAKGSVTGLHKTITVSDDNGGTETLTNMIETNADLQPGDSGGPLVNAAGKVVGMDTAGSTGSGPYAGYTSSQTDGYAIPIAKALAVVTKIEAGKSSTTIHVGGTAFLGVEVAQSYSGVALAGVVSSGPAAKAGLTAGDVITAIAGKSVSSTTDVQTIVLAHKPGDKVSVTYTDQSGVSQTTTVTLGSGPAQ
jgi:S1-C subfamily serine protease